MLSCSMNLIVGKMYGEEIKTNIARVNVINCD